MSMTPAKRRATRAKYEEATKARRDVRLGLVKKGSQKNKKRKK